MIKLQCPVSQTFGSNALTTYVQGGLKGHTGVDSGCGFGTPIKSYWDNEYVYKVLTKENPSNDGSGFTGVFTLVEQDGEVFEFLYGHCNPNVTVGQIFTKGTVLGTEANNGEVYQFGLRITLEMQKAGDMRGSHRHDQKRLLRKDAFILPSTTYITNYGGGYTFHNGTYYAVLDYDNGYRGCVDFVDTTLLPTKRQTLFKQMMFAVRDYQVECGLLDFRGVTDPKKIVIGARTLIAIARDRK